MVNLTELTQLINDEELKEHIVVIEKRGHLGEPDILVCSIKCKLVRIQKGSQW